MAKTAGIGFSDWIRFHNDTARDLAYAWYRTSFSGKESKQLTNGVFKASPPPARFSS